MSKYNLTPQKQLIDINEDAINFEAIVEVSSVNNKPFEGLVVSQKQLDSNPNLEFKASENGQFYVEIFENNGVFDNWYLVLRSNKDAEVKVSIQRKELPPLVEEVPNAAPELSQVATPKDTLITSQPPKKSSWKKWVILAIIIIGGIVLWYLYKRKPATTVIPVLPEAVVAPIPIEVPVIETPLVEVPTIDADLLSKINNILM